MPDVGARDLGRDDLIGRIVEAFETNLEGEILLRLGRELVRRLRQEELEGWDAHWHPLGFANLRLAIDVGLVLRLHVWLPEKKRLGGASSRIHDHTWDLESVILGGLIRNYIYSDIGDTDLSRIFYPAEIWSGHGFDHIGATADPVRLVVTERGAYSKGQRYRVPSRTVHSSSVLIWPAATMVLGRHRDGPPTRTFESSTWVASRDTSRKRMKPDECIEVLRVIERLLYEFP